jgi:hypothetical protein
MSENTQMDWVMIVLIMAAAPNYSQSYSHYLASFTTEKLCTDAAAAFENDLSGPSENGFKVKVRALCAQRKAKGGARDE